MPDPDTEVEIETTTAVVRDLLLGEEGPHTETEIGRVIDRPNTTAEAEATAAIAVTDEGVSRTGKRAERWRWRDCRWRWWKKTLDNSFLP